MTDRIKGVYVAFDHDIREDDVQCIVDAIKMIRHVQSVAASVSDFNDWAARERVRAELSNKIWDVLHPKMPGNP